MLGNHVRSTIIQWYPGVSWNILEYPGVSCPLSHVTGHPPLQPPCQPVLQCSLSQHVRPRNTQHCHNMACCECTKVVMRHTGRGVYIGTRHRPLCTQQPLLTR